MKLPTGIHPCGYSATNIAAMRWLDAQPVPPLADDMPECMRLALDGLLRSGFLASADGAPIPRGYGVGVRFVVSDEGRRVLRAADAAERRAAA